MWYGGVSLIFQRIFLVKKVVNTSPGVLIKFVFEFLLSIRVYLSIWSINHYDSGFIMPQTEPIHYFWFLTYGPKWEQNLVTSVPERAFLTSSQKGIIRLSWFSAQGGGTNSVERITPNYPGWVGVEMQNGVLPQGTNSGIILRSQCMESDIDQPRLI